MSEYSGTIRFTVSADNADIAIEKVNGFVEKLVKSDDTLKPEGATLFLVYKEKVGQ